MTGSKPPRLAVALLEHFVEEEPLVGHLVEGFRARPSRLWFWRQTLVTVLMCLLRPPDEIRPLRLVDRDPFGAPSRRTTAPDRKAVNLSASPRGAGVGGLGIVALAVLITLVLPQAWWLLAFSILSGGLLGMILVLIGRHRGLSARDAGRQVTLIRRD